MTKFILAIVSSIAFTIAATAALAHSGGTDANGCHQDRKRGGYHCH